MMRRRNKALTLIELLIVVGIIAILAAVGLVNFLEAQTRARVSAALGHTRAIAHALEAYAVDRNTYPPTMPRYPNDPLGLLADHQLTGLTTPISYLNSTAAMRDPFGQVRLQVFQTSLTTFGAPPSLQVQNDFPRLQPPNPERSLLYFHYPSLAARSGIEALRASIAVVISIGPDQRDSLGAYSILSPEFFAAVFPNGPISHPLDTIYDPTNGTLSEGDLGCFAGQKNSLLAR